MDQPKLAGRGNHGREVRVEMMKEFTWKRIFFVLLIILVAASSGMLGAAAGAVVVYRAVRDRLEATQPPAAVVPSAPPPEFQIDSTGIESTITRAVEQVGPAVVTVVGTIPRPDDVLRPNG